MIENGIEPHFSLSARLRLAVPDVSHHGRVCVYRRERIEIIARERSQQQSFGLDRLHRQYWSRPCKGGHGGPPLQALLVSLDDLCNLGVRLIHCFFRRQLATVRSRDEYSKNILDFIPLRSARARLGTLKRAKLSRIRRELREKLRILKHGAPRRRIARKRRLLHLLGGSCPNQKIESGVRVRRASRDRDQPVAYFGTSLALCAGHYAEAHLAGDPRFCRIAERADPRGPVDRHRRRALKQVRRNLTRVEARVTRWRVLAQLEHEFQRVDAFRTINRWPSARVKHLRAERPEDRHEIGHRRVAPSRAHHVPVNSSVARRSCS